MDIESIPKDVIEFALSLKVSKYNNDEILNKLTVKLQASQIEPKQLMATLDDALLADSFGRVSPWDDIQALTPNMQLVRLAGKEIMRQEELAKRNLWDELSDLSKGTNKQKSAYYLINLVIICAFIILGFILFAIPNIGVLAWLLLVVITYIIGEKVRLNKLS